MTKTIGGRSTQKGIYAQNWAAMSLFLQYVTQGNFRHIGFEGDNLEDFHLVFDEGRKIICESKYKTVYLAQIRHILDKIIKHSQLADSDEILIICKKVNKDAKGLIENFKYFTEDIKKKLKGKRHKFKNKHLKLLPQIRFWEVGDVRRTENGTKILMAKALNYPEPFWVPKHRLEQLTNSLVVNKVFKGSQKGEILTKKDFLDQLEKEKVQILEDDGYDYEKEKETTEERIKELIKAIRTKTRKDWCNYEITRIITNPSIHHFTLIKLENEKDLKLSDWDNLWNATYQSAFSIELFKIFENNIQDKDNQKFALAFILNTIGKATNYFREEFIKYDIVKLCGKILELNSSLEKTIFEVIKKVYKHSIDKFLYVKRRRDDSWEREKTAELLEELYNKGKNKKLKQEIIDYIVSNFNLVEDDGQYWHYTPPSIFRILKRHVSRDPEKLVPWFTKKCVEQYDKFYRTFARKLKFDGWEHMGRGISQFGGSFSITDRYFVTQVLTPSLKKLYEADKEKGLDFIVKKCLSLRSVSRDNPDFINRAALPILLEEYKGGKFSEEIFEILKSFVKMRKGIPWKNDLIFQGINNDEFTDEQKWKLVEVNLKEFENLPTNVFVEQIVFNIVSKPSSKLAEKAGDVIISWIQNPKYNALHTIGSYGPTDGILLLLENNFDKAASLLESYLSTDHFKNKLDSFDTYEVAEAVAKVIDLDLKKGLNILNLIYSSRPKLTVNQQIVLCNGIYKIPDDKHKRLLDVYLKFIKPEIKALLEIKEDREINNLKNINPIEKKFDHRHSRESLVQFAEKLAKVGKKDYLDAALWLLKVFIHDTDPPKGKYYYKDDPKGEFDEHKKIVEGKDQLAIRTVRGWCCFVIQKLVVPRNPETTNQTREIVSELVLGKKNSKEISIMRRLAFDDNYYVRLESCIPLEQLIRNRHTHLPGKKERFVSQKIAEAIEKLALDMLFDSENQKLKAVMKNLARVFTYVRTLGTKKANKILKIFLNSEFDEVATEITPLLVFYALFRKDAFKQWPKDWKEPDKFDSGKFTLFEEQLKKGKPTVRAKLAWQLERLPNEIKNSPEEKRSISVSDAVKLSTTYLLKLTDDYEHEVFNDIYRFIEEYIGDYFNPCFKLWKKCIETESKYFEDNWSENKLHEMYWWPFFYNGKILASILENRNKEEFLYWFKELAKYPIKVLIANDLDIAVEKLVNITNKKYKKDIVDLFKLLIKRNPKYYDSKQQWLREIKE